jgi:arylsulfatase A-like enzyme
MASFFTEWDPFLSVVVYLGLLLSIRLSSYGWSRHGWGWMLLALLCPFLGDVFRDLSLSLSLPRIIADELALLPLIAGPFVLSRWTMRELRCFLPALVSFSLTGSELLFAVFAIVSFGDRSLREQVVAGSGIAMRDIWLHSLLAALVLSVIDSSLFRLGASVFRPFEWFAITNMGAMDAEAVWTGVAANLIFFLAVAVVLQVGRRLGATRPLVDWTLMGLIGAGIIQRFEGRALTVFAEVILAVGVLIACRRLTKIDWRQWGVVSSRRGLAASSVAILLLLHLLGETFPAIQDLKPGSKDDQRPNVLLIVLDTVRAESMSLYGYERLTTPKLERRFADGIVFERAIAPAPWTLPTHVSLFTGLSPIAHHVGFDQPLVGDLPTLAEVLKESGYATAGFVGNIDNLGRHTGIAQGFAHYEDQPRTWKRILSTSLLGKSVFRSLLPSVRVTADDINTQLLKWLDGRGDKPFFAFLNYYDAHEPYEVPDGAFDQFRSDLDKRCMIPKVSIDEWGTKATEAQIRCVQGAYDGAIAYLDDRIDQLFHELEERGLLANTMVIITSDHGEQFGERGLFVHANSLYAQLLSVPLLVLLPEPFEASGRIAQPVGIVDIPATVCAMTGSEQGGLGGESFDRCWKERTVQEPEVGTILSSVNTVTQRSHWLNAKGPIHSIVVQGYHYILYTASGREELFHLVTDPAETRDLSAMEELLMQRMRDELNVVLQEQRRSEGATADLELATGDRDAAISCNCCLRSQDIETTRGWSRPRLLSLSAASPPGSDLE